MNDQLEKFRNEVNYNLAFNPGLAQVALQVVDVRGERPVIVALESERLSALLGRLRSVGGFANVFVGSETRVRVASVVDNDSAIREATDDLSQPGDRPGVDATVGMFLDHLEMHPDGVVLSADAVGKNARVRDAQNVEMLEPA